MYMPTHVKNHQLPNFIIIGAMKAGTDSLYHYMNAHPDIDMCKIKEPDFFLDINWTKGIDWYKNLFRNNNKLKGDASPNLSKYPVLGNVPERIYSIAPEVKLIYILRDPVKRITSHLHHSLTANSINEDDIPTIFDSQFGKHIIDYSKYYMQIERYLKFFKKDQILLLLSEDLSSDPDASMRSIFDFVGADCSFTSPIFHQRFHQSKDKIHIRNRDSRTIKFLRKLNNHPKLPSKFLTRSFIMATSLIGDKGRHRIIKQIPKPDISESTKQFLKDELKDDVSKLRIYMERDLKEWDK